MRYAMLFTVMTLLANSAQAAPGVQITEGSGAVAVYNGANMARRSYLSSSS